MAKGVQAGATDTIVRNRGRDAPNNKTNENLYKLLSEAGIKTTHPSQPDVDAPVFLTNSILCIKEGAMNGPILSRWVDSCTEQHLFPLIRCLKPPVVVGMGNAGWRAVRHVFALHDAPQPILRAAGGCWSSENQTRVFAVGHCGPLGIINRPWPQQIADWRRIGTAISAAPLSRGEPGIDVFVTSPSGS